MNFIQSYLKNINELRDLLVTNSAKSHLDNEDSNIIYVDTIEDNDYIEVLYYMNESKKPFCKIEFSDRGVHFYERKKDV